MKSTGKHPTVEALQHFRILEGLSADQLELLARSLIIKRARRGEKVVALGEKDNFSFFLLDGDVILQAADGNARKISRGDEAARNPLAQLIPRLYDVIAATEIEYLQADNQVLAGLTQHPDVMQEMHVETLFSSGVESAESTLKQRLTSDLANEQLSLPSLPDVAVRIGKALEDEATDAGRIAKIIQTDMAMTVKIIRVANSALYASSVPVDSCSAAVVRLGVHTTHQLVLSFALRELFHTKSSILQAHMKSLWSHSRQVAAISYVLAKLTGQFNPEHAMLAGLLHDIGSVAILTYVEKFPNVVNDESQLEHILSDMRGSVGGMILRGWEFMDDLVQVAEEAENWQRNPSEEPDYADLVNIAQLHSFIGTPRMYELPMLDQVPAFNKLALGELTPKMSLKILDRASKQMAAAEALLRT